MFKANVSVVSSKNDLLFFLTHGKVRPGPHILAYFRPGPHVSFKYARHNHSRCPMLGEVSVETEPN